MTADSKGIIHFIKKSHCPQHTMNSILLPGHRLKVSLSPQINLSNPQMPSNSLFLTFSIHFLHERKEERRKEERERGKESKQAIKKRKREGERERGREGGKGGRQEENTLFKILPQTSRCMLP